MMNVDNDDKDNGKDDNDNGKDDNDLVMKIPMHFQRKSSLLGLIFE